MLNILVGIFVLAVAGWMTRKAVSARDDGSPPWLWLALAVPNFVLGGLNLWIGFGGAA